MSEVLERKIPKFIAPYWYVLAVLLNAGFALIIYGINNNRRGKSTKGKILIGLGILYMIFLVTVVSELFGTSFYTLYLPLNILIIIPIQRADVKEIKSFLNASELEFLSKLKQVKNVEISRIDSQYRQTTETLIDSGFLKFTDETKTSISLSRTGKIIASTIK